MVRTARWSVIALIACLAGCNLLAGIFPDRLMSYEAFADLSAYIDSTHIGDYNFQIVRNSASGDEYLVLATDDGTYGDDCVVVFDSDLRVLGHYTLAQLNRMDSANAFNGRGAMVDAGGKIVVGNRRFTIGGRSLVYASTPPALYGRGVAIPGEPNPNIGSVVVSSGNVLSYQMYLNDWTLVPPVQNLSIGGGSNYKIQCMSLSGTFLFMLIRRDGPQAEIFEIPQDLFATGALCTPLDGCYLHPLVPAPDFIHWNTLGFTSEGFAAYRSDLGAYFRFDTSGVEVSGSTFDPGDEPSSSQRQLYGWTSGWYVLDQDAMSLERRKWWWN